MISVIICSLRSDMLEKTVKSIRSKNPFEIIVVGDRRIRGTRFIRQNVQSLNKSRNMGVKAASGSVVAFIDDDVIVDRGWLDAVGKGAAKGAGIIGGPIRPKYSINKPLFLTPILESYLAVLNYGSKKHYTKRPFFGANMAFLKSAVINAGGFNERIDRKGSLLLSNGDTEIQMRIKKLGYKALYLPKMSVSHMIDSKRLKRSWFLKRMWWQGISDGIVFMQGRKYDLIQAGREIINSMKLLPYNFERLCLFIAKISFIFYLIGILHSPVHEDK